MKRINLKTIMNALSSKEMKAVTGGNGRGEDKCNVTCHDGSGTFSGSDCVDIAYKNCSCPRCGYSCSDSCFGA